MADLTNVIYVTQEQFDTLVNGGSIVKGGVTYTYDENAEYAVEYTEPEIPTKTSDLTNDSGFIGDAPIDGAQYARKNGSWAVVEGGGGDAAWGTITGTLSNQTDLQNALNAKGTYSKPSDGIPKTDLSSSVKTSLGLADTALQSYTETDPVFTASAAYGITSNDVSNWNGKADVSDIPTATSELTNDSGFLTQHQSLADYRTSSAQDVIDAGKQSTISDLTTIRNGASAGATAVQPGDDVSELVNDAGYQTSTDVDGKIETHNEDTTAHQDIRDDIPAVVDNVTSTASTSALSANQGKLLNDRINNVSSRGRFLSLWNCVTGLPLTNPSGYPYTYHTGDFFIVNQTGTTNYIPNGSSYTGVASTTVYSGTIKVNDTIFYDGTTWSVFDTPAATVNVQDVYQNGESVLSDGVAYVVTPTALSDLSADSTHRLVTDTEKSAWNAKGSYSKPSGGIPEADLATSVQTSLGLADTALQSYTETDPLFVASPAYGISSSDISSWNGKGTYSKPAGGIPKSDLAVAVQTSLGLADTALQSHQSLSAYRTSSAQDVIDSGKVAVSQGAAKAGQFLVVGSDGNVTTQALSAWQGGSY